MALDGNTQLGTEDLEETDYRLDVCTVIMYSECDKKYVLTRIKIFVYVQAWNTQ